MNDDTALAIQNTDGFTPQQIDLIRRQIAPDASRDELALFLEVCRGTGLNPFMRQIHAVFRNVNVNGRWEKRMAIQTGIDGYRLLAARTGQLAGIDDVVFDSEDGAHPNRATVTVYRMVSGQRVPFTATARWTEYVQTTKDGKPTSMWQKMPYTMLGKCVEALALRKGFPAELSGVYTHEEMMQADNSQQPLPEPPRKRESARTNEPISEVVDAEDDTPAASERETTQESAPDPRQGEPQASKQQLTAIHKLCNALGRITPTEPMTYAAARELISELSEAYNSSRKAV